MTTAADTDTVARHVERLADVSPDDLCARGTALVRKILTANRAAPGSRLDPELVGELTAVAALLRLQGTRDDEPDYQGVSGEYRQRWRGLFADAGASADERSRLQAYVRRRIGDYWRATLPVETVMSIGLTPVSNAERQRLAQRDVRRVGARVLAGGQLPAAEVAASPITLLGNALAITRLVDVTALPDLDDADADALRALASALEDAAYEIRTALT